MDEFAKIIKTSAAACKTVKALNVMRVCVTVAAAAACTVYALRLAKKNS